MTLDDATIAPFFGFLRAYNTMIMITATAIIAPMMAPMMGAIDEPLDVVDCGDKRGFKAVGPVEFKVLAVVEAVSVLVFVVVNILAAVVVGDRVTLLVLVLFMMVDVIAA